jgi:hypothetical protein
VDLLQGGLMIATLDPDLGFLPQSADEHAGPRNDAWRQLHRLSSGCGSLLRQSLRFFKIPCRKSRLARENRRVGQAPPVV